MTTLYKFRPMAWTHETVNGETEWHAKTPVGDYRVARGIWNVWCVSRNGDYVGTVYKNPSIARNKARADMQRRMLPQLVEVHK